jgi:hypothetical protein
MQEEAESTFLRRYPLEGKSLAIITSGGSTGDAKKAFTRRIDLF